MDFSEDLQRVLWHEFGHFCIDLLESAFNTEFSIDDFWVSYHEVAISNHKWGGGVKMIPSLKWNLLVEDIDKTSFAMLGSISGCIFETIFFREFLKSSFVFKSCFCMKKECGGRGDFMSFNMICSEIRKKYGRNENFIKFSEIDLFDIYYEQIILNKAFIEQIDKLVIKQRDKILVAYENTADKNEFYYHFIKADLDDLKEYVNEVMEKTLLKETILEFQKTIRDKI